MGREDSNFGVIRAKAIVGPTLTNTNVFGNNVWYVDSTNGSDSNSGKTPKRAFDTIQKAINSCARGDTIYVAPGQYDETVTIARTNGTSGNALSNLTIIGQGGRGAAFIEPSTEDADGMIVHADDITIINLGIAAEDETAGNIALEVSGSRFRAYGCKIEGGASQIKIGPGTVAQEAAGTHGRGGDCAFYDCEVCWGTKGFDLTSTDFGAVTQLLIDGCRFHDLTTSSIDETTGSGGSAAVQFFGLWVKDCFFDDAEDGTAPTAYILLNDDNANAGVVSNCSFPTAINSGKNLVSTALHWVSNFHTGGLSTGQPS